MKIQRITKKLDQHTSMMMAQAKEIATRNQRKHRLNFIQELCSQKKKKIQDFCFFLPPLIPMHKNGFPIIFKIKIGFLSSLQTVMQLCPSMEKPSTANSLCPPTVLCSTCARSRASSIPHPSLQQTWQRPARGSPQ